jgi:hypothetical protein
MRRLTIAIVATAIALSELASARAPKLEIENAAAFARLYGVARYFYPSDAAADLDWNRFAVHGVKEVRAVTSADRLATALKSLFEPLGPGIEIAAKLPPGSAPGRADSRLVAWRYLGAGMAVSGAAGPYRGKRTNRAPKVGTGIDGFASLMQMLPAQDLRGKTVRLRGQVRATARDATGAAALWLRVDRPNQQVGFFDNMGNRPITEPEWREYAIEGSIADDATNVAFGAMASGAVTADFDAIELAARDAEGRWSALEIKDPGFEAAATGSADWTRVGTSTNVEITRPVEQPPQGRQFLRFAPRSGPASNVELFEGAVPTTGAHVDVDLGSGLTARVPLALSDAQSQPDAVSSRRLDLLRAALESINDSGDPPDVDVRLAGVVVAWNVFRHFYPYWSESGVDWDARLRPQLETAFGATTRDAHVDALRRLVADARDGHGNVNDTRRGGARAWLPVQFGLIDGQLAITASSLPAEAPVGAVVSTIDGAPAASRVARSMQLASGTTQWKQTRALRELAMCSKGTVVELVVESGAGPRKVGLGCEATQPAAEKRPDAIAELSPGVWYVDLSRARMAQIAPVLPKLGVATGVVFDLRGYPTDAGGQILPHLLDAPESDRWMHVARIVGPFGQIDGWESFGWNVKPASPRVGGTIVFLTDGRAISYAESVMGYVADRRLGTIIGGTTAGTNGNVATFPVPGGVVVAFTGMRVTGHDGRAPYHLVGVKPDIPAGPTLAGLRAGRDEILERALALIRGK